MPFLADHNKKTRSIQVLFAIIILVILTNISTRQDYADLDRTVTSIYNDRLMPSGYLFKITDHLYQKKLLLQSANGQTATVQQDVAEHNNTINSLIKNYEATYLTEAEKQQWEVFKHELLLYNKAEQTATEASLAGQPVAGSVVLQSSFDRAIQKLNELNDIQSAEGKVLQRHSHSLIGGGLIQSYLEIALLFILCILILVLIGASEKLSSVKQRHMLN